MAYSDYGAFVFCNGERRPDKEDAPLFATNEETFGENINNIPSGARIWLALLHLRQTNGAYIPIAHGVMGDGLIRVKCYKQGLPDIYELTEDGTITTVAIDNDLIEDYFYYNHIHYEYKGYTFDFYGADSEYEHYYAEMLEPDGTLWSCKYDYEYGAGFEE